MSLAIRVQNFVRFFFPRFFNKKFFVGTGAQTGQGPSTSRSDGDNQVPSTSGEADARSGGGGGGGGGAAADSAAATAAAAVAIATPAAGPTAETRRLRPETVSDQSLKFVITRENWKRYDRFRATGTIYSLKLREPEAGHDPITWIREAVSEMHEFFTRDRCDTDMIGLTFDSSAFAHGPAGLSFRYVKHFTVEDLWSLIEKVTQSNAEFNVGDDFDVHVYIVRNVHGAGRVKFTHESVSKKSVCRIQNDSDNLCLPRSLVVAEAYALRGTYRIGPLHDQYQALRDLRRPQQKRYATELVRRAKVTIPAAGCGRKEIGEFQRFYAEHGMAINVYEFSKLGQGGGPFYSGTNFMNQNGYAIKYVMNILLYTETRHFEPILNLRGAAAGRYFCSDCNQSYERQTDHRCSRTCPRCLRNPPCAGPRDAVECRDCNRMFYGNACYENHKIVNERGRAVCDLYKVCPQCCRKIENKYKHVCGEMFCKVCRVTTKMNHNCYMAPLNLKFKTNAKSLLVFYDFETQQDREVAPGCFEHVANLCVVQHVCNDCIDVDDIRVGCTTCGVREHVFRDNPVARFVKYVVRPNTKFTKIICIAQNAKAFDGQMVLKHLVERFAMRRNGIKVILTGNKIISAEFGRTTFIDSLNFFQMPLKSLPKAFGFEETKGYFPYRFNVPEHANYVGQVPDARFYEPDSMSPDDREKFLRWHDELVRRNYVFDFARELELYCKMDVTILRRACVAFRGIFIEIGNLCPYQSPTIASACSRLYRKNFLRQDTIGVFSPRGYRLCDNQSRKAVAWLLWTERRLNLRIVHAGYNREHRLRENILVDGYCEQQNHVFQFHGCWFHGCPRCFTVNRDRTGNKKDEETMDDKYERTVAISRKIRHFGYRLTEVWECDFDRARQDDPEIDAYTSGHPVLALPPLNPRDALYGGRTECTVSCYEVKENEKIRYVDFLSLYPYISKYGKFPLRHPKILLGGDARRADMRTVEGLVFCLVLPPRKLFHPVLPTRCHGKLMFVLCRRCCEETRNGPCDHENPEDRALKGTWVADEIRRALDTGYTILDVYEIWEYEVTQYNPRTKTGGLFVRYINTFLKLKQEASGWPADCAEDEPDYQENRERYLNEYYCREGIELDPELIERNPGLRSVAKLALNVFWGKFAQRTNLTRTAVIRNDEELMDLLTSPNFEVQGIAFANQDVLYASYDSREEAIGVPSNTNVVIAAYTTAQARLRLLAQLERLGDRAFYVDTDSIHYVSREGGDEYEPPIGHFLGDLTDELEVYGRGSYITKFVSGGPKCYAYVIRKPDGETATVCKVKGITLNAKNSRKINFDSLYEIVNGTGAGPIVLTDNVIRCTKLHDVLTRRESRTCDPRNAKRRKLDGTHVTLPFGHAD